MDRMEDWVELYELGSHGSLVIGAATGSLLGDDCMPELVLLPGWVSERNESPGGMCISPFMVRSYL